MVFSACETRACVAESSRSAPPQRGNLITNPPHRVIVDLPDPGHDQVRIDPETYSVRRVGGRVTADWQKVRMMKYDRASDFGGKWAQTYTEKCECGNVIEVSTQPDRHPEYYTEVFVKCPCGKSVGFYLPVN